MTANSLRTLEGISTVRQEIKKSRFVAIAGPVETVEAAKDFLERNVDHTASHNCWAWRVGQIYRFSDDGEPGGTAGKSILQAIDGQALDRVAIIVSRWFGGVLLGSGGLIRAYGGTAAMSLRQGVTVPLVDTVSVTLTCGFSDLPLLQARLGAYPGVQMQPPAFNATGADLSLSVPRDGADILANLVSDLTCGRASIRFDQ